MASYSVIEPFDVIKDIGHRFLSCFVGLSSHTFAFQQ